LREDKVATDVVRERKVHVAAAKMGAASKKSRAPATAGKKTVTAKPARKKDEDYFGAVRLSNPDRVYWPDIGLTKRDLAEYYAKVWDHMRPELVGRVIAIVRCPEGATGQCFFQKHATAGVEAKFLRLVPEPDG
jgi:bifunctional non-homologous end joining protein LigD